MTKRVNLENHYHTLSTEAFIIWACGKGIQLPYNEAMYPMDLANEELRNPCKETKQLMKAYVIEYLAGKGYARAELEVSIDDNNLYIYFEEDKLTY